MGGYGTYKFATQYPDLFAKAQPTVGTAWPRCVGSAGRPAAGRRQSNTVPHARLAAQRPVPDLERRAATSWSLAGARAQADGFDRLGYRYEFDTFAPAEHLTLAVNDQYGPPQRSSATRASTATRRT